MPFLTYLRQNSRIDMPVSHTDQTTKVSGLASWEINPPKQNLVAHDDRPRTLTWVANRNNIEKAQNVITTNRSNCQDRSDEKVKL